ncbi:MAG TPA: hypothetical protein VLG10_08500, partial [Methylomirabilota bacterium]|nr:hypothetical protein [Methylomirabilota bacterium]
PPPPLAVVWWPVDVLFNTLNFLLATAMWLILGRLVLRLFVRNPKNAIWQVFLISTEPPYRVSRLLTGGRVPERWLWLVSLVWLLAARILVVLLQRAVQP